MSDVYCLYFDYLAEKLIIKPLAEFAACNLIGLATGADAPQTGVVVGYTYSREAAEQIVNEKKLEALCKMSILCDAEHKALKEEYAALKSERDREKIEDTEEVQH